MAIKESSNINIMDNIYYGRQDATKEEADKLPVKSFTHESYKQHLQSLGLDEAEIVAFASIEAFGRVQDPEHQRGSRYALLDNYYYK